MLRERIASQSEVIRAIVSEYSPCCWVPHLQLRVAVREVLCRQTTRKGTISGTAGSGTKEMMQQCLIDRHVISLVAQTMRKGTISGTASSGTQEMINPV